MLERTKGSQPFSNVTISKFTFERVYSVIITKRERAVIRWPRVSWTYGQKKLSEQVSHGTSEISIMKIDQLSEKHDHIPNKGTLHFNGNDEIVHGLVPFKPAPTVKMALTPCQARSHEASISYWLDWTYWTKHSRGRKLIPTLVIMEPTDLVS